ncbi:hypothetical protein [Fluviicola sp.]|uniref:hypothetical protein n=1 Tax=Fluviicola sp. TaxID=1917219 RepID=UPI0031DBE6D6
MKNSDYLLNRVFLLALFWLLFNDFYLKEAFPSFLSGKLSDVAGLIVFSLFFTFLFGNRLKSLVFITTALLFSWWKSSLSTGFIENWNAGIAFYPLQRTIDYTDLFCLIILVPVYYYEPVKIRFVHQRIAVPVLLLGAFAIAATSKAKNLQAYSSSTYYNVQKSFTLKMTHAAFLKELSLSNITVEKNPNATPPSKPGDPHAYILKNFTISANMVVESMYISVKEKRNGIKLTIHSAALIEHPAGTTKEVRKTIAGQSKEYFSVTAD